MQFENPFGLAELIELGGSAAVVLLMIGVAAMLGFRMSARIDDGELTRLAEAEGVRVDSSVIAQNGRTAFARRQRESHRPCGDRRHRWRV